MNRYEMEPILNPSGRFVIYGDHLNAIEKLESRIGELENRLRDIGDIAHEQSTGPAEPDWLWHIRELAYELL